MGGGSSPPSRQMVQQGGSSQSSLWPLSCQCLFWQARSQYTACLHRPHFFRRAASAESCLPHAAHEQSFDDGGCRPAAGAGVPGGAAASAAARTAMVAVASVARRGLGAAAAGAPHDRTATMPAMHVRRSSTWEPDARAAAAFSPAWKGRREGTRAKLGSCANEGLPSKARDGKEALQEHLWLAGPTCWAKGTLKSTSPISGTPTQPLTTPPHQRSARRVTCEGSCGWKHVSLLARRAEP